MAELDRRTARRIRHLAGERDYCRRQAHRFRIRHQEFEERARVYDERVKWYEERAGALTEEIGSLTPASGEEVAPVEPGEQGPAAPPTETGWEEEAGARFRSSEGPRPVLLPLSSFYQQSEAEDV